MEATIILVLGILDSFLTTAESSRRHNAKIDVVDSLNELLKHFVESELVKKRTFFGLDLGDFSRKGHDTKIVKLRAIDPSYQLSRDEVDESIELTVRVCTITDGDTFVSFYCERSKNNGKWGIWWCAYNGRFGVKRSDWTMHTRTRVDLTILKQGNIDSDFRRLHFRKLEG